MATKTRRLADLLANIDDNSKVTSAGLLDATITAADLADDSVGAAEIIDDAVTAAAIADDAVGAAALASNAVVSASIVDANITAAKLSSTALALVEHVKPHIQPGTLQPAVAGKLLDGSTSHSGAYGTAQADGFSYYYTDIKGSKPIKDPRIGAHFGCQRHKFKSIQKLEQESAAHGINVYSIDGRDWMRTVLGTDISGADKGILNGADGLYLHVDESTDYFIEFVGYLSDVNYISQTHTGAKGYTTQVDGGTASAEITTWETGRTYPLGGRYVDAGSLGVLVSGQTLGIHTIRINIHSNSEKMRVYGIELIAQDNQDFTATNATNILTSAGHTLSNGDQIRLAGSDLPNGLNATTTYYVIGASGNNFQVSASFGGSAVTFSDDGSGTRTFRSLNTIQIPSQNVVSYGKKFSLSATAHHYNPFATKGDSSASTIPNNTTGDSVATGWAGSTSAYWEPTLDTATSLGLGAWESGGNFYRPVNGGRVVKWVDSSGTIKTSVNMMPPEAHSINVQDAGLNPATGTHNWSTKNLPSFGNSLVGSDLAVNGDFSSGAGWTLETGAWTISGGNLNVSSATNQSMTYRQIQTVIVPGRKYKVLLTASAVSAGTFHVHAWGGGAPEVTGNALTGAGTSSVIIEGGDGTTLQYIAARATGTSSGVFSSITMYEISDAQTQEEVVKTFNWREFGNGNANGGGAGSHKDYSMIYTTQHDPSFVMDDGLTALSGNQNHMSTANAAAEIDLVTGAGGYWYFTFIGTGFSATRVVEHDSSTATENYDTWVDGIIVEDTVTGTATNRRTTTKRNIESIVQNLPYGTHIIKQARTSASVYNYGWINHTVHQPKMPPIPENACIIADYMLMADFVSQDNSTAGAVNERISKGTRRQYGSRDCFFDETGGGGINMGEYPANTPGGYEFTPSATNAAQNRFRARCPSFASNFVARSYQAATRADVYIDNTEKTGGAIVQNTDGNYGSFSRLANPEPLGVQNWGVSAASNQNLSFWGFDFASPIHTSSHYQEFETPFLKELIGGDRNMEQTNLIVTPDGKTWDQVTRDTSYIGNMCINAWTDTSTTWSAIVKLDEWRGKGLKHKFNKDFAIAYNRVICLVDGQYQFSVGFRSSANDQDLAILINGTAIRDINVGTAHSGTAYAGTFSGTMNVNLKKGDYVQIKGMFGYGGNEQWQWFEVERI